ncbi:MAG TPA: DNA methyltransferase [Longimicrobiaceae bacterium]
MLRVLERGEGGVRGYLDFLKAKAATVETRGFDVDDSEINPLLKPHQRAVVRWAVRGGRRGIFAAFGLGKSVMQLEILRLVLSRAGGRALIVAPLGVRQEFMRDAAMLGTRLKFIRRIEEADEAGIHLTNYETVRDGKLDPREFVAASLDEAAVLRGFGGVKTFREFMRLFADDDRSGPAGEGIPYRFVATATPSPNEHIELLSYAAFLGIMEVGEAKTRFFRRNSEKADQLTLHPHKEAEFWTWVATWGLFLQKPSDLGFSDEGYSLPPLNVVWHEVAADHAKLAGEERDGQLRLVADSKVSVTSAARVKRESLPDRIAKLMEIRAENPDRHRIIWHDLEAERRAIEAAIPDVVSVYGSQDLDERERSIIAFSDGEIRELAGKPVMLGSGCNFQRHCHEAVFLGIGFKFAEFIQAVHRLYRFLQTEPVTIHLIYSEAERGVRKILERKWKQHNELVEKMAEIIRKYGLSEAAMAEALKRSIGVQRIEASGEGWTMVNEDTVLETKGMESDSVQLIVTSIPFSNQYEYTPLYNDFGHTDDDDHFWRQMDYLTPELFRVLEPGRIAAVHVKDRIVPGGINGLGFQTVNPVSDDCIRHFRKHGFAFMARKTIVTDVVRENNQTYRLGWTEQCKDGTKMGAGLPEYVLLFRKPPSDRSNSYADRPVVKQKKFATKDGWENPDGYSRARWQIDAHGFARSNGNRLLRPEDLEGLPADQVFQIFRAHNYTHVYDFEHHVRIGEALELRGQLPPTFMLLQPQSWHPDVWSDVVRMRTLNTMQAAKGQEQHLCPMPLDLVERLIVQFSMPGELVFDPFAGLGTVPYVAIQQGRRGRGHELNHRYWIDAVNYCRAAEEKMSMPTLFDVLEELEEVAA